MALQGHGQLDPGPLVLDPVQGLIDELPESGEEFLHVVGLLGTVSAHHGSRLSHSLLTSP